jgi:hypothetical protein
VTESGRLPVKGELLELRGRDVAQGAAELGMRPLVAHCHLGLGKLSGRTGRRQEGQEHLATAMSMYREMGMTYWPEKVAGETAAIA